MLGFMLNTVFSNVRMGYHRSHYTFASFKFATLTCHFCVFSVHEYSYRKKRPDT